MSSHAVEIIEGPDQVVRNGIPLVRVVLSHTVDGVVQPVDDEYLYSNAPVFVEDPNGDIVTTIVVVKARPELHKPDGTTIPAIAEVTRTFRFREDPEEALRQMVLGSLGLYP